VKEQIAGCLVSASYLVGYKSAVSKRAKLKCVRAQFVKGKQHYQILREIRYIPIRTVKKLKLKQPMLML